MIKKVKMLLYGAPGVGKSVFALSFPSPFFITTDGNYEWLDEFGAKEEDHKQLNSWNDYLQLMKNNTFEGYETIVIDLIEDLYKWCESEFCKKNKIDHLGDLPFGKGYSIVRNEFFVEISKLLSLNKNIIFLSHESSVVLKDKRGVESTIYGPSKTIPEVLRDQIEGRLRYVLRAKFEDEIEENKIKQKRILSLAKDSNEFSIIRGMNMDTIRDKIELKFDEFVSELNLGNKIAKKQETPKAKVEAKVESKVEAKVEVKVEEVSQAPQPVVEDKSATTSERKKAAPMSLEELKAKLLKKKDESQAEVEAPKVKKAKAPQAEEAKPQVEEQAEEQKASSPQDEMLKMIKAKLAAMKGNK